MLNTSALKKNKIGSYEEHHNGNTNLKIMANETIIDEGIRRIEENADNNNPQINDNDIIKSFHSMEGKIFENIKQKNLNEDEINPFKIDNFNLNEITKKYSDEEFIRSVFDNEKKLLVSVNEKLNKFSIFNENNNLIGYFTIHHIIKYLGDIYDTKQQFLKEIDVVVYQKSKELIKALVFKLKYNKKNKYSDIIISDYTRSGFMSDIELLIKLNNQLHKYQLEELQNDLSKVDINNRIKMEQNIKKFIFILLNYTLKLISIVSEQLKDDDDRKELRNNLINYSIGIVYRINLFVQDQLKVINNQQKTIRESLETNIQIKNVIKEKLDVLIKYLSKQTTPSKPITTLLIDNNKKSIKQPIYEY